MLCTASALKRIGVRWTLQNAGKLYEEDIAEIKKINNEQTELLKKVLEVVIHLYEEDSKKRK